MESIKRVAENLLSTEKVAPPAKTLVNGHHSPVINNGLQSSHEVDHGHAFWSSHETDHTSHKPFVPLRTQEAFRPLALAGGRERNFLSSDDNALNKQIQLTHAPDVQDNDVRPVLIIVEDILRLARPVSDDHTVTAAPGAHAATHLDTSSDKLSYVPYPDIKLYPTSSYLENDIVKMLAYPINRISCEMVCKCSGGGETHKVTMELLKTLSNYSWDSKVVIAYASFAINYGEFWLVEQHQNKNPLAKNIATLKDLTEIMANPGELKKQFEPVQDLLSTILRVTHCIIGFKELPAMYLNPESPEITSGTAHIPTAVYWSIRGLLVCGTTLSNLIGTGHEYITATSASWEILSLSHKLSVILEHLQKQMAICKELVRKKKLEDEYIKFKRLLESTHIDNGKILNAFFRPREDQKPLYHGSRKTNERLDVLRQKYVMLLISDLELPSEELHALHLIHNDPSKRHDYEILWLPVVDSTTKLTSLQETNFYNLRKNMPWFSAEHPLSIEPVLIRYIREELHFTHMPMLFVLDPQGKISPHDALPMMWIWGAKAFPFTRDSERKLWDDSEWNIELIADAIDPRIPEWINTNKLICLYGGDDVNWIRKFTKSARRVAQELNIDLEMLYVGKRNPKEKVRQCHEVITEENLSHIFATDYYDFVWYFWVRLTCMWNSKKQIGRTVENDPIMQGILDLLTYDSSEQGWAIFSTGKYEITMAKGDKVVIVLDNNDSWGPEVVDHPDKFGNILGMQLQVTRQEHHCQRLILPGQAGYIPESVVCTECGKTMDKYIMYKCCTD